VKTFIHLAHRLDTTFSPPCLCSVAYVSLCFIQVILIKRRMVFPRPHIESLGKPTSKAIRGQMLLIWIASKTNQRRVLNSFLEPCA